MDQKIKLLYIDEDIDEYDPYVEFMVNNNFIVTIAIDSDMAVKYLVSNEWDAVIQDIMFPLGKIFGEEGREKSEDGRRTGLLILKYIMEKIKQDEINYGVPVFVRTAVTNNPDLKAQCIECGVKEIHYFEKPGDPKLLISRLKDAASAFQAKKGR